MIEAQQLEEPTNSSNALATCHFYNAYLSHFACPLNCAKQIELKF